MVWLGGGGGVGVLEEWGDQSDRQENNYSFTAEWLSQPFETTVKQSH